MTPQGVGLAEVEFDMPARRDRAYEEAVALWRTMSDAPPPKGDAAAVIAAALQLGGAPRYERFQSRWLNDPTLGALESGISHSSIPWRVLA